MPVFEYKGFDGGGKAVSGIIDADNPKVARSRLRRQGLFPTDVDVQTKEGSKGTGLNREIEFSRYFQFITVRDIATLTNQMATLLGASVPMSETLAALVDQTEKTKLKVVLSQIKEKVNEGSSLAEALREHPRVFNNLYVHMVRAGERTGALDLVLRRLATFTENQVKLQGKVLAAMAYPILMSFVGVFILMGLFWGVIPRIRSLFDSLGGEEGLPILTRVVFAFGDFLISGWVFVLAVLLAATGFGLWRWIQTKRGRRWFDRFKLNMPLLGSINRVVAVSRFCRTLATLLASGVPIITALNIVRDVVSNVILAEAIDRASENIQEGQSIAAPLRQSGEFPPMVTHMISIGERTGDLEPMLTAVADSYEEQVDSTMTALTSILAPLLILVLGGVVFLVALGLLMPMMNISSRLSQM
ncbi:MAG: type II secretion system inner membrane protein GspF [Deltaproteobacteria bacterium]|nr:type II secretion system inner membrane protein GspF [Deltaproteobacteria bacterium]MBW2253988.1 type II secretion system inner membrane protein GspF [Deltaproteobacteria bacterium]